MVVLTANDFVASVNDTLETRPDIRWQKLWIVSTERERERISHAVTPKKIDCGALSGLLRVKSS